MSVDALLLVWALVLMLVSLTVAVVALAKQRPALLLFAAFFFVYFTIRPVMLLTGFYSQFAALHFGDEVFHSSALVPVFLYSSLGLAIILSSYRVTSYRGLGRHLFVVPAWSTRSVSLFVATWLVVVSLLSFRQALFAVSVIFCFALFGSCYLLTPTGRGTRSPLIAAVGTLGLVVALSSSVERRDWAVALFAVGWTLLLANSASYFRKLGYIAVLALCTAYVAVALRTEGEVLDRLGGADRDIYLGIVEWELDFSLVYDDLVVIFDKVPNNEDYLYGKSFVKPLYFWVPRTVWPNKGETLSREFSKRFNAWFYERGGSEPLTWLGDLYWNFGWFGLVFCWVLGFMQRRIDDTYLIAAKLQVVSDELGRPARATAVTLAAMMFYVYRGPIDTVWLNFGAFILVMWLLAMFQYAIWRERATVRA